MVTDTSGAQAIETFTVINQDWTNNATPTLAMSTKQSKPRRHRSDRSDRSDITILKLVTWGKYAAAAKSNIDTSSKTKCPLNPPKQNNRPSARIAAWYPRGEGGLPLTGRDSYWRETEDRMKGEDRAR